MADTLHWETSSSRRAVAIPGDDEDLIDTDPHAACEAAPGATGAGSILRTTVLPRFLAGGGSAVLERERFESLSQLGQGGMGEVQLVHDHDMQRSIAVKRLGEGVPVEQVQRFVAEIRTVAQLEHPNIVPVHDVGVDADGRFFFIMKHIRGVSLEALIGRLQSGDATTHARWPFSLRARLFAGVLNAVGYAHQRGVLHRDLKPANIMVGDFGEVTVMDWGISCAIAPVEDTATACALRPGETEPLSPRPIVPDGLAPREVSGQRVGTPLYMSPEQARGENDRLDQRSDVYSLGVVLHELLFLEHYLAGRTSVSDVLAGVLEEEPNTQEPTMRAGQTVVPPELGWYVNRAMQKDPGARFQTVHEMREELERVLSGRFRVQCQRTAFKRALHHLTSFSDRFPKTAIVGSTLVFALLLMGAVRSLLGVL